MFSSLALPVRQRAFTLLELLVVMAGFVAPRCCGQIGKSEVKVARAQIDALEKALDQYRLVTGRYPSSEEGLAQDRHRFEAQRPSDMDEPLEDVLVSSGS